MDGWSVFRKFSNRVNKRRSATPASVIDSRTPVPAPMVEESIMAPIIIPETQSILSLDGIRQPYRLVDKYPVPQLKNANEVLVKTSSIGLNPIDWKAPDYNFGIPELPYIAGRESSGDVCRVSSPSSRLKVGDRVIVISTDYRDLRKAAYQEFVVTFDFNAVRLPPQMSYEEGSTLGVAFVAASLALGLCMGVNFADILDGPDLFKIVKEVDPESIPQDVRAESLQGIAEEERAKRGDWLAIWGGSATSANLTIQLARLAGLKVAIVVDNARHGLRISNHKFIRPDLLVDSHDPRRAIEILQSNVGDEIRFGIDTIGKDTAGYLLEGITKSGSVSAGPRPPSPPATPRTSRTHYSHVIGLGGVPQGVPADEAVMHSVPFKLFHEVPAVGRALVTWLERLLEQGLISPPEIIDIEEGLENVNAGLDRMRRGEIRGGKLIVRVSDGQ